MHTMWRRVNTRNWIQSIVGNGLIFNFIHCSFLLTSVHILSTNKFMVVSLRLYSPVYRLTFTCWKYNNTLQCVVEALWLHCFISPVYAAPSPAGCGPPAWTPQSAAAPGSYHHPARAASCQQDHLCQCVVTAQYTSLPSHTALIAKLVCRWQASYADTGRTHGHHTLCTGDSGQYLDLTAQ